jgi:hypothetical protein
VSDASRMPLPRHRYLTQAPYPLPSVADAEFLASCVKYLSLSGFLFPQTFPLATAHVSGKAVTRTPEEGKRHEASDDRSLSRLSNVDVAVVPFAATQNDIANHAYVMRDERTVTIETVHAEIVVTDPRDVADYAEKFERFSAVALHGDEMREMLEELRDDLLREQENS